jgi:hypothetical protein
VFVRAKVTPSLSTVQLRPSSGMTDSETLRLDFAEHVHSYLGEFIRAADQKAAFLLVASAALLGWLTTQTVGDWKYFVRIGAMVLVGFSAALAVFSVKPRQHRLNIGRIAWDGILKSGGSDEYHTAISKLDDCGLQEITGHSFQLAGILRKKYRLLWLAIWFFICGGGLTVILLVGIVGTQRKGQSNASLISTSPVVDNSSVVGNPPVVGNSPVVGTSLTITTASPQRVPWWVEHFAVPILFVVVGAALGFGFGRLKDWLDNRKRKKIFLRAVRVELSVARRHLEGTLTDATDTRAKLDNGVPLALHLATTFQTGIYSSQIGRLNDVFDPLVIEVVQFYDSLMNLEKVKSRLTEVSFDLTTGAARKEDATAVHYRNTLDEVIRRINQLLPAVDALIRKLSA